MSVRILNGDCRDVLATLPAESVHCCVTSPPYWGLRDYGTAKWEDGDHACDHMETREFVNPKNTLGPNGFLPASNAANKMHQKQYRGRCSKCGARRIDSQIGLEPTYQEFVEQMVAVFCEVRRVLRADGTVWLNLGDTYAGGGNGGGGNYAADRANWREVPTRSGQRQAVAGLKPKDLCGIPWRVAFALQADGWWLRQDIIWSKPNPMPESVTDRCTKAHEYVFLLSKSERYYFDAKAIAEPFSAPPKQPGGFSPEKATGPMARNGHSQWEKRRTKEDSYPNETRNKRSVWEVATQPFSEAHFATFPPALIEPCILAGCPKGGTVLDPFGGAGTTGLVADRLQRSAILIELNPQYAAMAQRRICGDSPLFTQAAAE